MIDKSKRFLSFIFSCGAFALKLFVAIQAWKYIFVPMGAPQISFLQMLGIKYFIHFLMIDFFNQHKEVVDEEIEITLQYLTALSVWGFFYLMFSA